MSVTHYTSAVVLPIAGINCTYNHLTFGRSSAIGRPPVYSTEANGWVVVLGILTPIRTEPPEGWHEQVLKSTLFNQMIGRGGEYGQGFRDCYSGFRLYQRIVEIDSQRVTHLINNVKLEWIDDLLYVIATIQLFDHELCGSGQIDMDPNTNPDGYFPYRFLCWGAHDPTLTGRLVQELITFDYAVRVDKDD